MTSSRETKSSASNVTTQSSIGRFMAKPDPVGSRADSIQSTTAVAVGAARPPRLNVVRAMVILGFLSLLIFGPLQQSRHMSIPASITHPAQEKLATTISTDLSLPSSQAAAPHPIKQPSHHPTLLSSSIKTYYHSKLQQNVSDVVPKHIHLIYVQEGLFALNQTAIPEEILGRVEYLREIHPTWNVTLWDNAKVNQHFPQLIDTLRQINVMAWVSDVFRYFIVKEWGGIYLDTDILHLKKLDPLLDVGGSFSICETPIIRVPPSTGSNPLVQDTTMFRCQWICNAVIGAAPYHPALVDMAQVAWDSTVETLAKRNNSARIGENDFLSSIILTTTGPRVWTPIAFHHQLVVLRGPVFTPCGYTPLRRCDVTKYRADPTVLGIHSFAHSWKAGKSTNKRSRVKNR